jgi:hypothetical protein
MPVRSRYTSRRTRPSQPPTHRPAQAQKPKQKEGTAKRIVKGTARVLGAVGDYIAKNQADFARETGETSFEEDMSGIARRVGHKTGNYGRSERDRIRGMVCRDSDDDICQFVTGRGRGSHTQYPPEHVEFVVEEDIQEPARKKRRRSPKTQQPPQIIYIVER